MNPGFCCRYKCNGFFISCFTFVVFLKKKKNNLAALIRLVLWDASIFLFFLPHLSLYHCAAVKWTSYWFTVQNKLALHPLATLLQLVKEWFHHLKETACPFIKIHVLSNTGTALNLEKTDPDILNTWSLNSWESFHCLSQCCYWKHSQSHKFAVQTRTFTIFM